jgi:hypothetical protein
MTGRHGWWSPSTEALQVVLDDATVDRLRTAAEVRDIAVEQLIVQVLHHASFSIERALSGWPPEPEGQQP